MTNEYIRIAAAEELVPGTMKCLQVAGKHLLLCNVDGRYYVADEMCTHEDAPLCTGSLRDHYIKCPLHGSRFDLITGEALDDPAETPLKIYSVKIENGQVMACLEPGK